MAKPVLLALALTASLAAAAEPLRVAVVDTGLDLNDPRFAPLLCKSGHQDFTGTTIKDTHGHGTHVAGLIKQYAVHTPYCLIILKYYVAEATGRQDLDRVVQAFAAAVVADADIVNYSGGGTEFSEAEYLAIKASPRVLFVVAAGNEHEDLTDPTKFFFPGSYNLPNIIAVGATTVRGTRLPSSNYGGRIKVTEIGENVYSTLPDGRMGPMTGTSQATAIHTGKIIRGASVEVDARSIHGRRVNPPLKPLAFPPTGLRP